MLKPALLLTLEVSQEFLPRFQTGNPGSKQIVNLFRKIRVEVAIGKTTPQAAPEVGITDKTYYRWRKEFGGLKLHQAKRLKGMECPAIAQNWLMTLHWAQSEGGLGACSESGLDSQKSCHPLD